MSRLKQAFGILGLIVAITGVALGYRGLVWVAIGLLGLSVVLRMVIAAKERRRDQTSGPDEDG